MRLTTASSFAGPLDRPHSIKTLRRASCQTEGRRVIREIIVSGDRSVDACSANEVTPGKISLDPLVALRQGFNPLELADIDDHGLAVGLADGIQPVSVPGKLEADALHLLTGQSGTEGAGDFRADRT